MPPKKSRKTKRRGQHLEALSPIPGRGRPKKTIPSQGRPQQTSLQTGQVPSSLSDHSDVDNSPLENSDTSSEVSVAVSTVSEASTLSQIINEKRKRGKKSLYCLDANEEMSMLEFLQENPMLWDIKLTDFRRTDKKNKIWDEQSKRLDKTPEYLKGWFKSLRDIYTRLDKKKSGDGDPDLTEREQWIKDNFSFMKAATRHRPEPVNSVKAVINAHRGNLNAAEAACEDLADTDTQSDNSTLYQARSNRSALNDKKFKEEDILQSLQKRINQSGDLLKCISQSEPQPINECAAFANYVRDSLLTMSKHKFKKVRSAINKVLTNAMDEDSENESEPQTLQIKPPTMPPPIRPSKTPSYVSQSPSEMYQPPPHMWRHKPPHASVWASATKEYMEQYRQQPLQMQQQPLQTHDPRSLQQDQNVMPTYPVEFRHQTSDAFSSVLGPAAQVLDQSHNLTDL